MADRFQYLNTKRLKRFSIPFAGGEERILELQELSIEEGAVGCCIWQAGIALSRWIGKYKFIFADAVVIELGCGVGMSGIAAGFVAQEVIFTDYWVPLVNNIADSIELTLRLNPAVHFAPWDARTLDWNFSEGLLNQDHHRYDVIIAADAVDSHHGFHRSFADILEWMLADHGVAILFSQAIDNLDQTISFCEKAAIVGFDVATGCVDEELCSGITTQGLGSGNEIIYVHAIRRRLCSEDLESPTLSPRSKLRIDMLQSLQEMSINDVRWRVFEGQFCE